MCGHVKMLGKGSDAQAERSLVRKAGFSNEPCRRYSKLLWCDDILVTDYEESE